MGKTREEWIAVYEKKLGLKYEPDEREIQAYDPEKGFLSFIDPVYTPGTFEVHLMVGDGVYWVRLIKQAMREIGAEQIRFITRRNPKTWLRKYGADICAYIMEVKYDDLKV